MSRVSYACHLGVDKKKPTLNGRFHQVGNCVGEKHWACCWATSMLRSTYSLLSAILLWLARGWESDIEYVEAHGDSPFPLSLECKRSLSRESERARERERERERERASVMNGRCRIFHDPSTVRMATIRHCHSAGWRRVRADAGRTPKSNEINSIETNSSWKRDDLEGDRERERERRTESHKTDIQSMDLFTFSSFFLSTTAPPIEFP